MLASSSIFVLSLFFSVIFSHLAAQKDFTATPSHFWNPVIAWLPTSPHSRLWNHLLPIWLWELVESLFETKQNQKKTKKTPKVLLFLSYKDRCLNQSGVWSNTAFQKGDIRPAAWLLSHYRSTTCAPFLVQHWKSRTKQINACHQHKLSVFQE